MPSVTLARLLGQPEVSTFLRGLVARGRFANAYLFHGPPGTGKGTAALAFARALLCERRQAAAAGAAPGDVAAADAPAADATAADTPAEAPAGTLPLFGALPAPARAPLPPAPADDACGVCPACIKAAALLHPDLKFLFPVSGEERELDKSIPDTLQKLRDDPLFTFRYDRAASIRLSLTRDLQRDLAFRPYEGTRRAVVIRDCDRMREDQYSALLKSVEEPGAATVWVLTTARPGRVPATIRSRCQRVRFAPLAEDLVRAFLTDRAGVPERQARLVAALSGGSLSRALALRDEDATGERDRALELLRPAVERNPVKLWAAAAAAGRAARTGRETLRRTLELQQLWVRDLLRVRYGAPAETLVNRDREPALRAQAAGLDAGEARRRLLVIEEALRAVDGNVSPDLTLFSALARVAGDRLGEGAWPPHATGRWDA